MLVLTRKLGEGIVLGTDIEVKVLRISGSRVTLGIEAPPEVRVLRQDLRPHDPPPGGHDGAEAGPRDPDR